MNEETGGDPEQPGETAEREQAAWSSPVCGIALGLALSLVLWVVIALLVRLLCEWWLASTLFRGALDAALGAAAAADDGPCRSAATGGGAGGGTRPSPRPA
jgi:hypothetical protein